MLAKLLKSSEHEWREGNNVQSLLSHAIKHLADFNRKYILSDLVLAKSYIDELHQLYMRRENGEEG